MSESRDFAAIKADEMVEGFITSLQRWQVGRVVEVASDGSFEASFPLGSYRLAANDVTQERPGVWVARVELPSWQSRQVTA